MDITDRIFLSILLLTCLTYPIVVRSEICYRCANEFIVMYWGHFLPIQAEDELVADSVCVKIDERSEEVRCVGACLTLNVTIGEGNKIRTVGMMRDCQKKYYSRDSDNNEGNRRCRNQTVKIRQRILNAEYCFCFGSYCNGDDNQLERSMSEFRQTPKYTKIRNNQRNGAGMKWSLCVVPYFMLIYIVCLKLHLISL